MADTTQEGYLVLADIGGFSAFLAASELDHAHEIVSDILELIVTQFRPLMRIAKLEGDAVFAYAPTEGIARGETLLELFEATYTAFSRRIEAMHRQTTCTCRACQSIRVLDLKFLAHHGPFIASTVAGNTEVLGQEVNVVHRLLKNHITETTGLRAYTFATEACIARVGVGTEEMRPHREVYDVGEVSGYVIDLGARLASHQRAQRFLLEPADADLAAEGEVPAEPARLWSILNDPVAREVWEHTTVSPDARPGGRTREGARNHCAHGKSVIVQEIVDWRPFEYFTTRSRLGPATIIVTYALTQVSGGTRLRSTLRLEFPFVPRLLCRVAARRMFGADSLDQELGRLRAVALASPAPSTAEQVT